MDCKDLMINDFVYVIRGYDKHLTIEKIKGVIADKDEPYPVTIFTGETVSLNDIEPIELTEDILVKNGFDKDERSKYFHVYTLNIKGSYDFDICWSSVNGFNYEGDFMLTYVHQLQHLLRLCGVEKELTI